MIKMQMKAVSLACLMVAAAAPAWAGTFQQTATGVTIAPDAGAAKEIRLQVMADNIVHVVKVDQAGKELTPSLMTIARPCACTFDVKKTGDNVLLSTKKLVATVSLKDGRVQFADKGGAVFLKQDAEDMKPVTVGGKPYLAVKQGFNFGTKDAFYGTGQHQNNQVNLNGEDVDLLQHNMDIAIPFLVSDKNYGILWDNNGITRFGDPRPYGPINRDLKLTDAKGQEGALTARYYIGGKLALERREEKINYQYLKDVAEFWPKELKPLKDLKDVRVVWEGKLASDKPGVHKMKLYSSDYATLTVDGKQVMDVWRQGWNPWYHNFEVDFAAGKPVDFKLEWKPEGGMIYVAHNDPLPKPERHSLQFSSEIAEGLNYYVIRGTSIDNVIGGYRVLTGTQPLMPKWAYGFWQSRQRYETQDQLLDTVKTYRQNGWPLDNIVQDWFYWPENGWGSHDWDPKRFPNPKGMVDEVHKMNARIMLSVWGKFYENTANYQELKAKGHMWTKNVEDGALDWVGPGYKNSHYSPYAQEARDIYYRQMKTKLVDLGFDAWWLDNTEPDVLSNTRLEDFKKLIGPTVYGPGEITFNSYSLLQTQALYDGLKRDQPNKRQFILSRSGFAGIQRNYAAIWSGDTVGRWNNLYDQISAGVGATMSGIPNWTHDIGGYAQETRFQSGELGSAQENRGIGGAQIKEEDLKEWRELNLRWWQFGAFTPLFRSHGEVVKREIHMISPEGSPMRDSMVWYLKLRYRLMPYIYATASSTYFNEGSIMRGLVMDFPNDPGSKDVKDQYLFGHAFLVAPVYEYGGRERKVYLPQGAQWYDYYTGERLQGGRTVTAAAPETRMPLFVKAGSIVPMGPVTQYVDEKPDAPITLKVYTGANGQFSFYEDDGVTEDYQRGKYSRIPLTWNEKAGTLTIGQRAGDGYQGMQGRRTFRVHFVRPGVSSSETFDSSDKEVVYEGKPVTVKL